MFDMSWGEIMVIGGVALIVIGPKDLPKALRTLGQMTTKVRRMAGEFRGQFDEAMREAELEEVRKEVEGLNRSVAAATTTAFNPIQTIRDELKGAVESRPASAVTPAEAELFGTNPGPLPAEPVDAVATDGPIEEVGPTHRFVPAPDESSTAVADTQPALPPAAGPILPQPPARPSDAAA